MAPKSDYHGGKKRQRCYFCEAGPPLEEHHIIPQRFDGPDTKDNIVELCQLCHQRLERLYDKSFYEWFGIQDEQGQRKFHRQCETSDCSNVAKVELAGISELMKRYTGMLWSKDVKDKILQPGFYCRPCAAKRARFTYERWRKRYWRERQRLHKEARKAHEGRKSGMLVSSIKEEKPTSAEWLLEFTVVDEADN